VRWLLLKDLRILGRSPLLAGLLVVYPVVLAVLIGLALSAGPEKPKVAFANLVPPDRSQLRVGGERIDAAAYAGRLFASVDPIRVASRAEAVEKVRSGEALAALIVPADITRRLQGTLDLAGGAPPTLEVVYSAEDPVKRRFVEAAIESRLAEANRALSERLTGVAARSIAIIARGGRLSLLGSRIEVLGLQRSADVLAAVIADLPAGSSRRTALEPVERFARLAGGNLDVSEPILGSIGRPVAVSETVLEGRRAPLDAFAAAVAVTVALMFVTLLLAAGMLALEREERAFGRLVRGLVTRTALVAEKIGLAALCSFGATALMLAGLAAFLGLDWGRAPLWLGALAAGATAFAAMGVAIGAVAREVRAASLLALALALPVAFAALVPVGAVGAPLSGVIEVVSGAFPFDPALRALDAAINGGSPAGPLAHLAALTVAFGALARLALRRFA
jgi:ABC-type transport system involved in cytochrome c biogenesis permease component